MDSSLFDIKRYQKPKSKATSARSAAIEPFVTKLNHSRTQSGYKPLTPGFYASKMSHIKEVEDLHAHYKQCEQAKNFYSLWWYMNCPKKKTVDNLSPVTA